MMSVTKDPFPSSAARHCIWGGRGRRPALPAGSLLEHTHVRRRRRDVGWIASGALAGRGGGGRWARPGERIHINTGNGARLPKRPFHPDERPPPTRATV